MRRSALSLDTIAPDVLLAWLTEQSVEQIMQALNKTGKPLEDRVTKAMYALKAAIGSPGDANLERFKAARRALGDTPAKIGEAIRTAFEGERGFPDFFLLPEMPNSSEIGFVIMLRAFASLKAADLYLDEVDARVDGRPDAFHRVGRLSDGLRFAVMQKLAFLFLRIGLAGSFEKACTSATELVVETLMAGEQ